LASSPSGPTILRQIFVASRRQARRRFGHVGLSHIHESKPGMLAPGQGVYSAVPDAYSTIILSSNLLCLWLMMLFAVSSIADTIQTTSGRFHELHFSDYLYLKLMDQDGKISSFYCKIPKCAEWEMNQERFMGKQVTIGWQFEDFFFKELNKTQKIRTVQSFQLKK
jgi:hypothetical protein